MAREPAADPAANRVRPVVRTARGLPGWLFGAAMVALALVLFAILDAHRRAATAPPVRSGDAGLAAATGGATTLPPLAIPPPPLPPPPAPERIRVVLAPRGAAVAPPAPVRAAPPPVYLPPPPAAPFRNAVPEPTPRGSSESALVYDATTGDAAPAPAAPGATGAGNATSGTGAPASAVRATLIRHAATIVTQGTLIPATLETALDSTRPGLARAVVSRDVVGFDGSHVLIARGSRLTGEYRADLQRGQKRLLVTWTRLVRPDGASIALASPSADPLGRIGVAGSVNSHFFERFAGAILQSALEIGVTLASRAGSGNSIAVVGAPGVVQGASSPIFNGNEVAPTLRVRPGVAINVFVARDLDFTAVESRR